MHILVFMTSCFNTGLYVFFCQKIQISLSVLTVWEVIHVSVDKLFIKNSYLNNLKQLSSILSLPLCGAGRTELLCWLKKWSDALFYPETQETAQNEEIWLIMSGSKKLIMKKIEVWKKWHHQNRSLSTISATLHPETMSQMVLPYYITTTRQFSTEKLSH